MGGMTTRFSIRAVLILTAIASAYFAGWRTATIYHERSVWNAELEAEGAKRDAFRANLRLEILGQGVERNGC